MSKEIKLANPRGFCAGVDRAIDIVNKALDIYGSPVYVKHEVVHNKHVIKDLVDKGVIFVESLDDVPSGSILIYSAHGVSKEVSNQAKSKNLKVFDATCPLVTKVHFEIHKYASENIDVVLIGHSGHPEVEGTMGQYISDHGQIHLVETLDDIDQLNINSDKIAYVTQTTLSVSDTQNIIDYLKTKFPNIIGPRKDDICYATQNRQDAVKQLALESEFIIVIGSRNSSNSNRLKELAEKCGASSILIDDAEELDFEILSKYKSIGITAGASAPESIVQNVVRVVSNTLNASTEELGENKENIYFRLPPELR